MSRKVYECVQILDGCFKSILRESNGPVNLKTKGGPKRVTSLIETKRGSQEGYVVK